MVLLPEFPPPQITKTGIVDGKDTFVSPILQMSLKRYMTSFGSRSAISNRYTGHQHLNIQLPTPGPS